MAKIALRAAVPAAFFLVALLVYGTSLRNGFVALDDDILVTENLAIRMISPASLAFIFTHFDPELYIPLTFLSYQVDYLVGGLRPFVFHLTNLLLHTANAGLVFALMRHLLCSPHQPAPAADPANTANPAHACGMRYWRDLRRWIPFAVAALFLVHPLNTEAVAWVSARKDVLSAFFFLLSLVMYIEYVDRMENTECKMKNEGMFYIFSIGAFALALMAKVSIVTLPAVLLLLDWYMGRRIDKRSIGNKIPYFLLAFLFGIIALFGKKDVLSETTFQDGLLIAAKGTAFYLSKFLLPTGLSVLYPYTEEITVGAFLIPLLVSFSLLTLLLTAFLRKWRTVAFSLSVFLLALFPSFVNFTKASDIYFASDRYMYLPMVGLLALVGWGFTKLHACTTQTRASSALAPKSRPSTSLRTSTCAYVILPLVILVFSFLSFRQSLLWRDTETLFAHVLSLFPDSHLAHNKFGGSLLDRGETAAAVRHFEESLRWKPNPRAYFNLGIVAIGNGDLETAHIANERALALDPDYAPAYENLGFLQWEEGDRAGAKASFEQAAALDPFSLQARLNLAAIETQSGSTERAAALLREVLALDPGNEEAHGALRSLESER